MKALKIAYFTIISLLIVLLSIIWLIKTPIIYQKYLQDEVETYVSVKLNSKISFASFLIKWDNDNFGLYLKDVNLISYDKSSSVHIDELNFYINTIEYLSNFKFVWHLYSNGISIVLNENEQGFIQLSGVAQNINKKEKKKSISTKKISNKTKKQKVEEKNNLVFFYLPKYLHLANSSITINKYNGSSVVFSDVDMLISNNKNSHKVQLKANLSDDSSALMILNVDDGINGNFYTEINKMPIETIKKLSAIGFDVEGFVDGRLWGEIKNSRFMSAYAMIENLNMKIAKIPMSSDRTIVQWNRNLKNKTIKIWFDGGIVDNIKIKKNYFTLYQNNQIVGENILLIDNFDIREIYAFEQLFSAEQIKLWRQTRPRGRLKDVKIIFNTNITALSADFKNIGFNKTVGIPGIKNFTGKLLFSNKELIVDIDSKNASLDFIPLFRKPFSITKLQGAIRVNLNGDKLDDGISISSSSIFLQTPFIKTHSKIGFKTDNNGLLFLDLQTKAIDGIATGVPFYLPIGIMDKSLIKWLDEAFISGNAGDANLIFRGNLLNFPFKKNEGTFDIGFSVDKLKLKFLSNWSAAKDIKGQVHFLNNSLFFNGTSGILHGVKSNKFSGNIKILDNPVLNLKIAGTNKTKTLTDILTKTPLKKDYGDAVNQFNFTGGNTYANVVVKAFLNNNKNPQINGNLHFKNSQITAKSYPLEFKAINGNLKFSKSGVFVDKITADFLGSPANISINTKNNIIDINMESRTNTDKLIKSFLKNVTTKSSGNANYKTNIKITLPNKKLSRERKISISIYSDLEGAKINLPAPFNKKITNNKNPLKINLNLPNKKEQLWATINYNNNMLYFSAPGEKPFKKLNAKDRGYYIKGKITSLALDKWLDIFYPKTTKKIKQQQQQNNNIKDGFDFTLLKELNLDLRKISYNKQITKHVKISSTNKNKELKIKLDSIFFDSSLKFNFNKKNTVRIKIDINNIGEFITGFGFKNSMKKGYGWIDANLHYTGLWSIANTLGNIEFKMEKGVITNIETGPGRILSFLDLGNFTRRLSLNFDDVLGEGFEYSKITGDYKVKNSYLYTRNTLIKSSIGHVAINGILDIEKEEYNKTIGFTPSIFMNIPILATLATAAPVIGASVWAVLKVLKNNGADIAKAQVIVYHLTGQWSKPKYDTMTLKEQEKFKNKKEK
ncbi:MAG: hypothetical protein DRQ51_06750 [Gammaproteobacteria bacterium]|nr:MAG: hypothetical protein DRQ51_06750 [Gammaproteobacteria bacterium]